MRSTPMFVSCTVLGSLLLCGCATVSQNAAGPVQNQSNQTVAATSENTTGNVVSTDNAPNPGLSNITTTSTPSVAAVNLVHQQMNLATQGKVYGISYAAKTTNLDQIQQDWGKADSETQAGAGMYVTYGKHAAAFGFNKGAQIFDVRSYSKALQSLTANDITDTLGLPGDVRTTSDSTIYLYTAGPDFQLLFVFSHTADGKMQNHVDHVSVFYPAGTIDQMALNIPMPSVVIDNPPGSVGNLFTFSVQNPPANYRVAEFEWIPTSGTPVVNTMIQAENNGKTGRDIPGFSVSGDGQTLSFLYTDAMKKQTGIVKLIYQANSGSALIGQSQNLTLK